VKQNKIATLASMKDLPQASGDLRVITTFGVKHMQKQV
jgi:hypothetical protein